MQKLLSLSLGLLTAASSFAAVKTVTIPAIPDGKRSCSFVVNEIPDSLGLTDLEYEVLNREIKGRIFKNEQWMIYNNMDGYKVQPNIEIIVTDSLNSVNDTIICDIFNGKSPRVSISDTTICAESELSGINLPTYEKGTYWGKNIFTGKTEEQVSSNNIFSVQKININIDPDTIVWLKYNTTPGVENVDSIIFDNPSKSGTYLFSLLDTITGCQAAKIANITVKDCSAPVMWQNYDGPKEIYVSYESEILSILNKDSIIATNPMMNCICPLPLDTIFESTKSDDIYSCGYFKYDVTVKLAASGDTITVYLAHVTGPELSYDMDEYMIPNRKGNCTFTVPEFYIPEPDCICPRYFYISDMTPNAGDTITESTDVIFTFTTACNETFEAKSHVYIPKFHINVATSLDTVRAIDSIAIQSRKIVDITSSKWALDKYTGAYGFTNINSITLDIYRESILSENKVWGDGIPKDQLYILDNGNKSGFYYYVATDTLSGCRDTALTYITVLSIDTTSAPVIPTEISEVKGDVYTITGVLVKKDVYFKDVMDRLKEGIYIFNKKKIYINRKD